MIDKINRNIKRQLRWSEWSDQDVYVQKGASSELEIVIDGLTYAHAEEINDFEIRQIVQKALDDEYTPPVAQSPTEELYPPQQPRKKIYPSEEAGRKMQLMTRIFLALAIINIVLMVMTLVATRSWLDIWGFAWRIVVILSYATSIYGIDRQDKVGYALAHVGCIALLPGFPLFTALGGYWLYTLQQNYMRQPFGL